jgi:hypothetical protein
VAIFHLTAKVISRTKGQSALAAAAYRSGQKLCDYSTDQIHSYRTRKERIEFTGIFAPAGSPGWVKDREKLWNAVERIEHRKNSSLAREVEVALPCELTPIQRLWLVQDFVRTLVRRGLVVDVAIHGPDRGADARNHHAHIMMVERQIGVDGFSANKDRTLQKRSNLREWRQQWATLVNSHLARHGHAIAIDHRSLADQGSEREPGIHLGFVAAEIERRGAISNRGEKSRAIKARNDAQDINNGEVHVAKHHDRPEDSRTNNRDQRKGSGADSATRSARGGIGSDSGSCLGAERARVGYSVANRLNRTNAGGYRRFDYGAAARLRLALYRSLIPLVEARRAAEYELNRLPDSEIMLDLTDIWGIGLRFSRPVV